MLPVTSKRKKGGSKALSNWGRREDERRDYENVERREKDPSLSKALVI